MPCRNWLRIYTRWSRETYGIQRGYCVYLGIYLGHVYYCIYRKTCLEHDHASAIYLCTPGPLMLGDYWALDSGITFSINSDNIILYNLVIQYYIIIEMFLLYLFSFIFIVVIVWMMYYNLQQYNSQPDQSDPCNRCGQPRNRCGCKLYGQCNQCGQSKPQCQGHRPCANC